MALIAAVPAVAPVMYIGRFVVVAPWSISTVAGETVTFEVSLLVRVMKTPPEGAGPVSVRGKVVCCPGARVAAVGSVTWGAD